MATYHLSVKFGGKGQAANHADYIERKEKYRDRQDLEYSEEARRQADLKSQLLEIQKKAARYYYYELRQEKGRAAYEYLKGRALSDGTIKRFGLGYSSQQSREMYQYLKHEGYSDALLKESGLFSMDERSGFYDKFWNRMADRIVSAGILGNSGNHRRLGNGQLSHVFIKISV